MILTVLKNLFSKPATRQYPFKDLREPVPGFRGKITCEVAGCKLCGACARACPAKAIEVNRQSRQIKYFPFNCIYCGNCVDGCPAACLIQDVHYAAPSAVKPVETWDIPAPPPKPEAPPAATPSPIIT